MISASASKNAAIDLQKQIELAKSLVLKVGLPKDTGTYPNGASIIQVGAVHEFGAPERGIPRRSFLREPFIKNEAKIKDVINKSFKWVKAGNSAVEAMNKVGIFVQGIAQKSFTENDWTANRPRTTAKKGSSQPLIDSGRLRGSITYIVEKK